MQYSKQDAKAYARAHFRGVWAATATPFDAPRENMPIKPVAIELP